MSLGKPKIGVVKVMRGLSNSDSPEPPAVVYDRNGRTEQQHLSPEVRAALSGDVAGYFEAERIDGRWWIGKRLPNRGW